MSEHHAMDTMHSEILPGIFPSEPKDEDRSVQADIFEKNVAFIRSKYEQLESSERQQRARTLSQRLQITELELVAAQCGDMHAIQLVSQPREIFSQVGRLGRVMALTRNDHCVAEKHGTYSGIQVQGPVGLVLGPDIDLRMFFKSWKHVWAVQEHGRNSLQFFDQTGQAVHKIYCTALSNRAEYVAIVGQYRVQTPVWPEIFQTMPEAVNGERKTRPPEQDAHLPGNRAQQGCGQQTGSVTERARLRSAWLAMEDTHDFYPLLREFNITRLEALRAVGEDLALSVIPEVVEDMLGRASRSALSIMCFVSNRAMIQIHTGPVVHIQRTGRWLNVLDPDFNLHLDTTQIASVWIVLKPTSDGLVTSLELFDHSGQLIAQFFGARKPGSPELLQWRELLHALSTQVSA